MWSLLPAAAAAADITAALAAGGGVAGGVAGPVVLHRGSALSQARVISAGERRILPKGETYSPDLGG